MQIDADAWSLLIVGLKYQGPEQLPLLNRMICAFTFV